MSRFEGYLPLALKTFATRFYSTTSYLTADIRFGKIIQTFQPTWCVDFTDDLMLNTSFSAASAFTYEAVASNNALVGGRIPQPGRLNQVAYLLNTVTVGVAVAIAPPGGVFWAGASASNVPGGNGTATYGPLSGCGPITAGDLQATFWALTQAVGSCDAPGWLCTDTLKLGSVSSCNVAYLWTLAFAAVPDGASYSIPTSDCSSSPVVPVIVAPSPTHQILLVAMSVDVFSGLHGLPSCGCSSAPPPPLPPPPLSPPSPPGCPAHAVHSHGTCVPATTWTCGVTVTGCSSDDTPEAVAAAVSAATDATHVSSHADVASVTVVVTLPSFGTLSIAALQAAVSSLVADSAFLLPPSAAVVVTVTVAPPPPAAPPAKRSPRTRALLQSAGGGGGGGGGAPTSSSDAAVASTVDGVSLTVSLPGGTAAQAASAGLAITSPSGLAALAAAAGSPGASAAVTSPPVVTASTTITLASPSSAAGDAVAALTQPALAAAGASAGIAGALSITTPAAIVATASDASSPPSTSKLAPAAAGGAGGGGAPASSPATTAPSPSPASGTKLLLSGGGGAAIIASVCALGLCVVAAVAVACARRARRRRTHIDASIPSPIDAGGDDDALAASKAGAHTRLAAMLAQTAAASPRGAAVSSSSPASAAAADGSPRGARMMRFLEGKGAGSPGALDGAAASPRRDAQLRAFASADVTGAHTLNPAFGRGGGDLARVSGEVASASPLPPPRFGGLVGSDDEGDAESPREAPAARW